MPLPIIPYCAADAPNARYHRQYCRIHAWKISKSLFQYIERYYNVREGILLLNINIQYRLIGLRNAWSSVSVETGEDYFNGLAYSGLQ
jgi:hypothetical protein